MASIIKVDTIQDQDGNNIISEAANTITIGASGDTITIPSGATLANSGIVTGFQSTGIDDNATSTAITIDSGDRVRIGNTSDIVSPSYTEFMVIGDYTASQDNGITFLADATNSSTIGFTDDTHSTVRGAITYHHSGDSLRFNTFTTERMRITNAGNVGIGTSSPSANLEVRGASSNGQIYLGGSTTATYGQIYSDNDGTLIAAADAGDNASGSSFRVSVDGSEAMRIDSGLNVLIGTTSFSSGSKGKQFENNANAIALRSGSATTATTFHNEFHNPNGAVGSIRTSGTSTSYVTSSDYRLKENVSYDFDATTRLKQLRPARFNFIADANTTLDGFLAHEVQDVVPEAISGEKDAVNEDGSINPQGIDQSKLVPLLVKTIQELEARITALENNQP
jgi:hypothetical protein